MITYCFIVVNICLMIPFDFLSVSFGRSNLLFRLPPYPPSSHYLCYQRCCCCCLFIDDCQNTHWIFRRFLFWKVTTLSLLDWFVVYVQHSAVQSNTHVTVVLRHCGMCFVFNLLCCDFQSTIVDGGNNVAV